MVLRMATSYRPQVAQVNEESALESFLDLMLSQHPYDEDPEPREVHAHLEVDPPRTWYYYISPNSCTLVILLQVDFTSSDEPEIVCEGCYETKNTFIFTWSSIPGIRHYHWLCGSIYRLPLNSKENYLVRTIRHILNFLQL
jgi:hypothetical protein